MEKLKEYGYKVEESKVDGGTNYEIQDQDGEVVAWIWQDDNNKNNIDWECQHPEDITEFGDDDECGECPICGAICSWFWKKELVDEGHDEDGNCTGTVGEVREIMEWWTSAKDNFDGVFRELISA